jgi:hypothetical protein
LLLNLLLRLQILVEQVDRVAEVLQCSLDAFALITQVVVVLLLGGKEHVLHGAVDVVLPQVLELNQHLNDVCLL